VFEVIVEIDGTDGTLRPSMTTSNKIVANEIAETIYVPLECLHSDHDSVTYVYRKLRTGIEKQEVIVGETNSNEAVVKAGVKESEELFLSVPPGSENIAINYLPEMNGKRKKKNEEEGKEAIASTAIPTPLTVK
ncbi:MAG TPA: RND transporter, partial [Cytophagales bacterium]|nr:RND transporter [Cytophagales bacterium]